MSMMPKSPQQRSDLFLSLVLAVLFNFSVVGMQKTLGTPMFGVFMLLMIFFALGLLYIAIKPFLLDFNDRKDEEIEEEIASKFIQAVKEGRLQLVQSFIEDGVLYLAREYEYLVIQEGRIFLTESREDHTLLSYPRIYDLQEASPC